MKISMRRSSVEQGQKGEITATIELSKTFQGEAVLGLKNLPKGVKLVEPKPHVTAQTREVVFDIQADADSLAGLYKDIACDVAVTIKGETVHQQAGSALLRVDPARTAAVAVVQ
jgi:Holliday junction resolvase